LSIHIDNIKKAQVSGTVLSNAENKGNRAI